MNISQIYEKEKEYKFFKLLSETNDKGIIRKEFKEYKLKAYIDYQSYNSSINPIKSIDTRKNLVRFLGVKGFDEIIPLLENEFLENVDKEYRISIVNSLRLIENDEIAKDYLKKLMKI